MVAMNIELTSILRDLEASLPIKTDIAILDIKFFESMIISIQMPFEEMISEFEVSEKVLCYNQSLRVSRGTYGFRLTT